MTRRHGTSHKISGFERSYRATCATNPERPESSYHRLPVDLNGFKLGWARKMGASSFLLSNCTAKSPEILAEFHGKSLMGTGARAFLVEAPRLRNENGMTLLQCMNQGVQPSTKGYSMACFQGTNIGISWACSLQLRATCSRCPLFSRFILETTTAH